MTPFTISRRTKAWQNASVPPRLESRMGVTTTLEMSILCFPGEHHLTQLCCHGRCIRSWDNTIISSFRVLLGGSEEWRNWRTRTHFHIASMIAGFVKKIRKRSNKSGLVLEKSDVLFCACGVKENKSPLHCWRKEWGNIWPKKHSGFWLLLSLQ